MISLIEIVVLTTILLQSQMNFLMFPTLEIMELKLRAEIWALNCMLSQELIYVGFSFYILSGPFGFFMTAWQAPENIVFISSFKFSMGVLAI